MLYFIIDYCCFDFSEKSRNKSSVTDKQSNNSVSPKTSAGFPQKPHWKFTASGISKVMDKVTEQVLLCNYISLVHTLAALNEFCFVETLHLIWT